jgi:hypothetical protein
MITILNYIVYAILNILNNILELPLQIITSATIISNVCGISPATTPTRCFGPGLIATKTNSSDVAKL